MTIRLVGKIWHVVGPFRCMKREQQCFFSSLFEERSTWCVEGWLRVELLEWLKQAMWGRTGH